MVYSQEPITLLQLTMQNANHSTDSSCCLDLFSRFSFSNLGCFLLFITCLVHQYLLPSIYYHFSDIFILSPRAGPVKNCLKKPFHGFFNFSDGQVRENPSTPLKLRVKWYLYLSMNFQQITFEHVNPRKGQSRAIVIFK